MRVFDVRNSHTWTRNNYRVIRESVWQVCFKASKFNRNCRQLSCVTSWRYAPSCKAETGCFQCNGAPAHYGELVRQWLNATYQGRWIELQGSIAWPLQSLDLTDINSFLWGYVNELLQGLSKVTWQEFKQLWQASMSSCKVCLREFRMAHCRLHSNGRRPLRKPIVT
jgi:hypothetical protein